MNRSGKALRRCAAGLLVWALLAGGLAAAAPLAKAGPVPPSPVQGLTIIFHTVIGGLDGGTTRISVGLDGDAYRMRAQLTTAGLIGFLTHFSSDARSRGRLAPGDRPEPRFHRVHTQWMGDPRFVEESFAPGHPVAATVDPSPRQDDRDPVPPALTEGAMDPLSAGLEICRLAATARPQPEVIPVFDGWRRYDLLVTPDGLDDGLRAFKVHMRRLAGFSHSSWLPASQQPNDFRLYFAAPDPALAAFALPMRVESDSPFGAVVIHLVEARADAAGPALATKAAPGP